MDPADAAGCVVTTILAVQTTTTSCQFICDSRVVSGERPYRSHLMPKVVSAGGWLIGTAGSAGVCDFVQYAWQIPEPDIYDYPYMAGVFVPSLRSALSEAGLLGDKELEFQMLVARDGRIYQIESDLSVLQREDGAYAIGTGAPYAIGAWTAGADALTAVEIAIDNDVNSGFPIQVFEQGEDDNDF